MEDLKTAMQVCGKANRAQGDFIKKYIPEITKLMASINPVIKKLSYSSYARHAHKAPHESLLAVNTILRDSNHPSPDVRCLSINTMSTSYLPHQQTDDDDDTRSNGAIASIWQRSASEALKDVNPMVRRQGLISSFQLNTENINTVVQDMLFDSDPLVSIYSIQLHRQLNLKISENNVLKLLNKITNFNHQLKPQVIRLLLELSVPNEDMMFDIMSTIDGYIDDDNIYLSLSCIDVFLKYSQHVSETVCEDIYNRIQTALIKHLKSNNSDTIYTTLTWIIENFNQSNHSNVDQSNHSNVDQSNHSNVDQSGDSINTDRSVDREATASDQSGDGLQIWAKQSRSSPDLQLTMFHSKIHLFLPNQAQPAYINSLNVEILNGLVSTDNIGVIFEDCLHTVKIQPVCLKPLIQILLTAKTLLDYTNTPQLYLRILTETSSVISTSALQYFHHFLPYEHDSCVQLIPLMAPLWKELTEKAKQTLLMILAVNAHKTESNSEVFAKIADQITSSRAKNNDVLILLHSLFTNFLHQPYEYEAALKNCLLKFKDSSSFIVRKEIEWILIQIRESNPAN